jgi:hypothetical protein
MFDEVDHAQYCREHCRPAFKAKRRRPPCSKCDHREPSLAPENRDIAAVFRASATQCRCDASGAVSGLDYPAVQIVAQAFGCDLRSARMLAGIRILESAMVAHSRSRLAAELARSRRK